MAVVYEGIIGTASDSGGAAGSTFSLPISVSVPASTPDPDGANVVYAFIIHGPSFDSSHTVPTVTFDDDIASRGHLSPYFCKSGNEWSQSYTGGVSGLFSNPSDSGTIQSSWDNSTDHTSSGDLEFSGFDLNGRAGEMFFGLPAGSHINFTISQATNFRYAVAFWYSGATVGQTQGWGAQIGGIDLITPNLSGTKYGSPTIYHVTNDPSYPHGSTDPNLLLNFNAGIITEMEVLAIMTASGAGTIDDGGPLNDFHDSTHKISLGDTMSDQSGNWTKIHEFTFSEPLQTWGDNIVTFWRAHWPASSTNWLAQTFKVPAAWVSNYDFGLGTPHEMSPPASQINFNGIWSGDLAPCTINSGFVASKHTHRLT